MLLLYSGTDREAIREAANKALGKERKKKIVRITDANSIGDLQSVLQGAGMFGESRVVVLDGVFANEEMRTILFEVLPRMKATEEQFFVLEGKLDADIRKKIEKYAETFERFDLPSGKQVQRSEIFSLAHALKRGDKKALWVSYQRARVRNEAPEAIHGVLFWGAKDMFLKSSGSARARAETLVAELAELPHEARRRSFELEYALERYILSVSK